VPAAALVGTTKAHASAPHKATLPKISSDKRFNFMIQGSP
jgi:hypothetical protein